MIRCPPESTPFFLFHFKSKIIGGIQNISLSSAIQSDLGDEPLALLSNGAITPPLPLRVAMVIAPRPPTLCGLMVISRLYGLYSAVTD